MNCVHRFFAMNRPEKSNKEQQVVKEIGGGQERAQQGVCNQNKVHKCHQLKKKCKYII